VTYGSIGAGDVTETYVDDGQYLQVNEVAGGNAMTFDFLFEGLPDEVSVYTANLNGRYQGNPGHNIILQIWNYDTSAWVAVTGAGDDFPSRGTDDDYNIALPNPIADYISGGQLKLQINHTSAGANNHYFYVDDLYLTSS
jgi:hypothetical protein